MSTFLVQAHTVRTEEMVADPAVLPQTETSAEEQALIQDHRRFRESLEQLGWYWDLVRQDPHPGNLQALGQYWSVLVEAALRHMEDEAHCRPNLKVAGPRPGGDS